MSLLDLYEKTIAKSLEKNLYTDSAPYTNAIQKGPLQFTRASDAKQSTPVQGDIYNGNEFTDKNKFAPIAVSAPVPGLGRFDVFAIANWLKNISQEFGIVPKPGHPDNSKRIAKGINFAASQFLLATFNPGDPAYGGPLNQIYNPLSIALSAVPGLRGTTTLSSPTLAAAASLDGKVYGIKPGLDPHLLMRQGKYKKAPDANALAQLRTNTPGFRGDIAGTDQNTLASRQSILTIQGQVDQEGETASIAKYTNVHKNLYTPSNPYGRKPLIDLEYIENQLDTQASVVRSEFSLPNQQPVKNANSIMLQKLFDAPAPILASVPSPFGSKENKYSWVVSGRASQNILTNPASTPANVDVLFPGDDPKKGTTEQAVEDDECYMPFCFEDCREKTPTFLYFRAFLKDTINENFSPNWQSDNYYGRVDEVPVYQNTSRMLDFSFDVVAWDVKDLRPLYIKLTKLQSMVYPSYDTQLYLQAGPLVRLRIGDLICGGKMNGADGVKQGLPGYINNLSFAYDDGIWNIKKDFKVPRKISVSVGFTVIHEGNPGIYKDNFGARINSIGIGSAHISVGAIRGVMETISGGPIAELPTDPFGLDSRIVT